MRATAALLITLVTLIALALIIAQQIIFDLILGVAIVGGVGFGVAAFLRRRGERREEKHVTTSVERRPEPDESGVNYSPVLSEVVTILRSSRNVIRASSLLSEVRKFCFVEGGAGSNICTELDRVEELLRDVRRINYLHLLGRDLSYPLTERLRALKEAIDLCNIRGIECEDIKAFMENAIKSNLKDISGNIRSLIEEVKSLHNEGRVQEALSKVSEILRLCSEYGISDLVKECDEASRIKSLIEGVKHEVTPVPTKPVVSVSLTDVCRVLSKHFPNLVSGYGCVEGYSPRVVEFAGWMVPEGFEGSWECCLLGSGGWGSAYLCRRRGGSGPSTPSEAVFKVPDGFEALIEGGYLPTVSERLLRRVTAEAEVCLE